jgi:site-specific DNA recombinase
VRVVSVTQKIDDTPEGEMLEGFIEVIDEYYSANLALEVKKGLKENALKGKYTGGKVPYGLRVDEDGYFCPDEKTAPIVRRIFEQFASGVPKGTIVKMLNEEGYRNQYGRFFNVRTIFDMLQNEKYVGVYIYRHTHEETIKLEGVIKDPIIDVELWEKVTALRQTRNKPKFRDQKRYYYLTGKTVCGKCGHTFCGAGAKKTSSTNLAAYYKCSGQTKARNGCKNGSLNKDYYEQKILEKVTEAVFTPKRVRYIAEQVFKQLEAERKAPKIPTATLKKQLADVKAQQAELLEIMLSSKISRDILEAKEAALATEQKTLEKNIKKNNELESSQIISVETIEKYINAFKVSINEKKEDEHRYIKAIFDTFLKRVVVGTNEIKVEIKVDFSAFDFTPRGEIAHFRGALRTITPLEFNVLFQRKKHTQRLK